MKVKKTKKQKASDAAFMAKLKTIGLNLGPSEGAAPDEPDMPECPIHGKMKMKFMGFGALFKAEPDWSQN